jgi:replicative DNA helicase
MLDILYLLSTRENYDKYYHTINKAVLSKETVQIANDIEHYYKSFDKDSVDWEDFSTWFCVVKHSSFKEEKLELFRNIFSRLSEYEPDETYDEIVHTMVKREYATKIAEEALAIADGTSSDMEKVRILVGDFEDKYLSSTSSKYERISMPSFSELNDTVYSSGAGLDWRLDCLNQAVGPLRIGDLVVVAKRPETGGTTFACSEATHMATQLDDEDCILYFANEEAEGNYRFRLKQATLGCESTFFHTGAERAEEEYLKRIGNPDKIQVIHDPNATIHDLREMVESLQPKLLIIDQLWKVGGFDQSGDVQRIGMLYNEARKLAQEFCPVIAIHQADVTAEGERYIGQHQMHLSKTAVQGEADAIITIGVINEAGFEHTRFLNIPKNKLLGGPKTDESLRHSMHEVTILPERARFKDY